MTTGPSSIEINLPPDLRTRFLEEGYIVVPDVVPLDLCRDVIDAISSYIGLDPETEPTFRWRNVGGHGIIPLHHHQALWNLRQHRSVYEVFRAIYESDDLWVSMDRASYKPPCSAESRLERAAVHWDCDPWTFDQLSIQGLVYLNDTNESQGAFSCVPSLYKRLREYCSAHEHDEDRRHPSVSDEDIVAVPGSAGSLVLFHRLMPHTSGVNTTDSHRFVQYVAMEPAGDEAVREQRVKEWREKLPPAWAIRQQIEGQEIPEPGPPASLTELGERLVGIR